MQIFQARHAIASQCVLGETPLWDPNFRAFVWVDIRLPAVHRWTPATGMHEVVPGRGLTGGIVMTRRAGVYFTASSEGIGRFSFAEGFGLPLAHPIANEPDHRYNEIKCDPAGNIWVGTMQDNGDTPTGRLLRIAPDGTTHTLLDGILVPNAICWPASDRLTFADSPRGAVNLWRVTGNALVSEGQLVAPDAWAGLPDGIAVDAEGGFWNARFGAGHVIHVAPDGTIDARIDLPTTQITDCAFGGRDLHTLFITTSKRKLTEEELRDQPTAGDCFTVELPVGGLPDAVFAYS